MSADARHVMSAYGTPPQPVLAPTPQLSKHSLRGDQSAICRGDHDRRDDRVRDDQTEHGLPAAPAPHDAGEHGEHNPGERAASGEDAEKASDGEAGEDL